MITSTSQRTGPDRDAPDENTPDEVSTARPDGNAGSLEQAASSVHHLDNRGTSCALGLVRVKQRLSEIPLGDMLEMVTRDRFAPYEVPAWVEREGLELESMRRSGWWLLSSTTFRIRKTTEVAAPRVRA